MLYAHAKETAFPLPSEREDYDPSPVHGWLVAANNNVDFSWPLHDAAQELAICWACAHVGCALMSQVDMQAGVTITLGPMLTMGLILLPCRHVPWALRSVRAQHGSTAGEVMSQ